MSDDQAAIVVLIGGLALLLAGLLFFGAMQGIDRDNRELPRWARQLK